MDRFGFTAHQIIKILKEAQARVLDTDHCRRHGFIRSSSFKWKANYTSIEASPSKRLVGLKEENRRLNRMYADLSLELTALKEIID